MTPLDPKPRLLLAIDEAPGSLAAVRGLRAAGYEPWVAAPRSDSYAIHSRASAGALSVPDAKRDPEAFVAALAEATARLAPAAVLPCTEGTLHALAGREHMFSTLVATQPPTAVERATDKQLFGELARAAGIDTPATFALTAAELEAGAHALSFPAVLKPPRTVVPTGAGTMRTEAVRYVPDERTLRALLSREPYECWLLEPFVEGRLVCVSGIVWNGELVCALHQVAERVWPAPCGTITYARTITPDRDLELRLADALRAVPWNGIFSVDLVAAGGVHYALDLNPRVYASLGLAITAGHNLPAIWADLLLGGRPRVGPYRVGVRYRAELQDLRALLGLARAGRPFAAVAAALPRGRTAHAVATWDDPQPALVVAQRVGRRLGRGRAAQSDLLPRPLVVESGAR